MAKSLPGKLLSISLAFVADASRSSVSVDHDAPASGAQMLQIERQGRKEGIMQQSSESLKANKPPCLENAVIFDFLNAKMMDNNLGGQGPGQGTGMRFGNVGKLPNGDSFDMTVETLNDDYVASNPRLNGLRGKSGQINCNADQEAQMKFTMVTEGTNDPVVLPAFYISVYDIDQNGYMSEEVRVSGYDEITIPDDAEINMTSVSTGKILTSLKFGRICDNPKEPTNLHVINCYGTEEVDQRRRAFTMLFKEKSSFEMTFRVFFTRDNVNPDGQGRNLLFGGPTNLIEPCNIGNVNGGGLPPQSTTTLPQPTLPPLPPPKTTKPPCIQNVVELNFENATVSHNNLGGQGPDDGEAWLLFSGIGKLNGNPFDMKVVTNNDDYLGKIEKNGLNGKAGQINVKVESHADLTFSFIDSTTGDPVTLDAFYISLFDIDYGPAADEVIKVNGYDTINIPEENEYNVVDGLDGGKTFTSDRYGDLCDNPKDPHNMGIVKCKRKFVDQRKRSFSMLFKHKSGFDVTFLVPAKPNTEKLRAKYPGGGRNMQFSGTSALSDECP